MSFFSKIDFHVCLIIANFISSNKFWLSISKDISKRFITNLNLSCTNIENHDISIFGNLTNLIILKLNCPYMVYINNIKDLTPLINLKKLKTLHLISFSNKDITPLGNLTTLHELNLFMCQRIENIIPLGKLTNLREL